MYSSGVSVDIKKKLVVFSASCCYLRRRGAACEAVEAAEAVEAVAAVEAVEAVRARACECEWRRLPGRRSRVASVEPLARGMPERSREARGGEVAAGEVGCRRGRAE